MAPFRVVVCAAALVMALSPLAAFADGASPTHLQDELANGQAQLGLAQQQASERPWNSVNPTQVDEATVARTPVPARLTEPVLHAAVVLVVCVDLQVVASTDQYLDRVGVISGASIYPFAWNILLAARQEGYGGTLTTLAVAEEPRIQELLGLPAHVAVCAVMPLGKPLTQLTRLRRKAVPAFAMHERWGGAALTDSQ